MAHSVSEEVRQYHVQESTSYMTIESIEQFFPALRIPANNLNNYHVNLPNLPCVLLQCFPVPLYRGSHFIAMGDRPVSLRCDDHT